MKFIIPFLIIGSVIFSQCSSEHTHEHHTHEHDAQNVQQEEQPAGLNLSLNDGQRWEANPETTEQIQRMAQMVRDFNGSDFTGLKADLESSFGLIFERCTMKGEAHDQLHNYLLPMRDHFAALEASDKAARTAAVSQLQEHLDEFYTYFQ